VICAEIWGYAPGVMDDQDVLSRLRDAVRAAQFTQKAVAARLGMEQGTLSKKLNGVSPLELRELLQILEAIGQPPAVVFGGESNISTVPPQSGIVPPSTSSASTPDLWEDSVQHDSGLVRKIATRAASLEPEWQERALAAITELCNAEQHERVGKADTPQEGGG
jgi:transcriptional regulator with XRE-family HTH domain